MSARTFFFVLLVGLGAITRCSAFHATSEGRSALMKPQRPQLSRTRGGRGTWVTSRTSLRASSLLAGLSIGPSQVLAEAIVAAPSGINVLPLPAQAAAFFAVYAYLAVGTAALTGPGFSALKKLGWFDAWERTFWSLGPGFMLAGTAHYFLLKEFCNIYPPPGTWGIWYLPGSPEFHVIWTGIAEFLGGLGLTVGTLGGRPTLARASAAALLGLTLAVTPANIYMFTHGAQIPPGVETPVLGHFIRMTVQILLLSMFACLSGVAGPNAAAADSAAAKAE